MTPQHLTTLVVIGAAIVSVIAIILALVTRPKPDASPPPATPETKD